MKYAITGLDVGYEWGTYDDGSCESARHNKVTDCQKYNENLMNEVLSLATGFQILLCNGAEDSLYDYELAELKPFLQKIDETYGGIFCTLVREDGERFAIDSFTDLNDLT